MKLSLIGACLLGAISAEAFSSKTPPLSTPWTAAAAAADVNWKSYPRPQLERSKWLNLNGIWQFENATASSLANPPFGKTLKNDIKVPYCMESGLSGYMGYNMYSFYRTTFKVPSDWGNDSVLLNFGAVDNEATVFVNGKQVGYHRGGYTRFQFDITDALKSGDNELLVHVYDPTDNDGANPPLGKQRAIPSHIFYTSCSGLWQTVFLEPAPKAHITRLDVLTDMNGHMSVTVIGNDAAQGQSVSVEVMNANGKMIANGGGAVNSSFTVTVANPKLWSPNSPNLYDFKVTLGQDVVKSYTGFRSIEKKMVKGVMRPVLNGEFIFQWGPLDQGFWPDGIYTPPSEEAMVYDLKVLKKIGMNMLRKHIKVETDLFYYWTDKLGLMVFQDMPAMVDYRLPNSTQQAEFERELAVLIDTHKSFTSIVTWIIYNEGWGQLPSGPEIYLTPRVRSQDPSRLIDSVTGWHDHGAGDYHDNHHYSSPQCGTPWYSIPSTPTDLTRINIQGEFGGIGENQTIQHLWPIPQALNSINQTYEIDADLATWNYRALYVVEELTYQTQHYACSGGVYTQTTDVEGEVNGLLTYDRRVLRCDVAKWQKAANALYAAAKSRS